MVLCTFNFVNNLNQSLHLVKCIPDISSGISNDFITTAHDLEFYADEYFIADGFKDFIKVYDNTGCYIRTIGRSGHGPGDINSVYDFSIDNANGNLYCSEQGNNRITIFEKTGKYLGAYKTYKAPLELVVSNGKLYCTNLNESKKTLFSFYNEKGEIIKFFGKMFVEDINNVKFKEDLYSNCRMILTEEYLIVVYSYIPFIQFFDRNNCDLKKTITISEFLDVFKNNIVEGDRLSKGNRIKIKRWNNGAWVDRNNIYIYIPQKGNLINVYSYSGKLLQKIAHQAKYKDIYPQDLLKVKDGLFYFTDYDDGQIKIYSK